MYCGDVLVGVLWILEAGMFVLLVMMLLWIVVFGESVFTATVFLCSRVCGLNRCYRWGLRA